MALIGNALSLREVPMAYAAESSDSLTSSFTYTVIDKDSCSLSGSKIKGQKYDFFLNSVYPSDNMIPYNSSAILKISDLLGIHIVNITLNIASGESSGSGSFSVSANKGEFITLASGDFSSPDWNGSFSKDYVCISKTVDLYDVQDLDIKIYASNGSLYIDSYTIEYETSSYKKIKADAFRTAKYTIQKDMSLSESGQIVNGSTADYTQSGIATTAGQLMANALARINISNLSGIHITKIIIRMKPFDTLNAYASLEVYTNGNKSLSFSTETFSSSNWLGHEIKSSQYYDIQKTIDSESVDDISISIGNAFRIYVSSFSIVYKVNRLDISGNLSKSSYYVGEKFSLDGLHVNGYWNNNNDDPLDVTEYVNWEVSPSVLKETGSEVVVSTSASLDIGELLTVSKDWTVNVKKTPSLVSISIESNPAKTVYYFGDSLDLSGLEVIAHYDDGDSLDITPYLSFEDHVINLQDVANGSFVLKISYGGMSASLKLDVLPEYQIGVFRELGNGEFGIIAGTVTGVAKVSSAGDEWNVYFSDGDKSLLLYGFESKLISENLIGNRIAVAGTIEDSNGLKKVIGSDFAVGGKGLEILPKETDNYDVSSLEQFDSSLIHISGLKYISGIASDNGEIGIINLEWKGNTITMCPPTQYMADVLSSSLSDFLAKTQGLEFEFTGHLEWNNGPQLSPTSIDEFSCPDYDAVMAFIDEYMQPDVSQSDEGDGKSCLEWYPKAKAALEAMTEDQRYYFLNSKETEGYAARYNNWAKAYGEGATSSLGTIMSSNDTAAIIALVALSSATVAAAGFMIASRRRKAK